MSTESQRPQGPDARAGGGWIRPTPWGRQPVTFFTVDNSYAAPGSQRPKSVRTTERPADMPPRRPAPAPLGSVLTGSVLPTRPEPRLDLGAPVTRASTPAPATNAGRPRDPRPTGAMDVPPAPAPRPEPVAPPPAPTPERESTARPLEPQKPFEVSLPEGVAAATRAPTTPPRPAIAPKPLPGADPSMLDRASEALAPAASVLTRATARKSTRRRRTLLIAGGVVAGVALLLAVLLMTRPGGEPEPTGILPTTQAPPAVAAQPLDDAATADAPAGAVEGPEASAPSPAAQTPVAATPSRPQPAPARVEPTERPEPSPALPPATRPSQATPGEDQPAPVDAAPEPIIIPIEPLAPPPSAPPAQTDPDAPIVTRP